jgi:hypothetical protein
MPIQALAPKAVVISKAIAIPKAPKESFDAVMKQAMAPKEVQKNSPVQQVIGSMVKSENRLMALVNKGLHSRNLSTEQILALQASIYTASLEIDVVAKGVEQITSGTKTLLQSQI